MMSICHFPAGRDRRGGTRWADKDVVLQEGG